MKVKFLQAIAGGIDAYVGDVKEVTDKEAKRLINAGICQPYNVTEEKEQPARGKKPRLHNR